MPFTLLWITWPCLITQLYAVISVKLNDWENHKTDTLYENSLIMKKFLFGFVNSYGGLFYVALLKQNYQNPSSGLFGLAGWVDQCSQKGYCLYDLMLQLAVISIGTQMFNQFLEYVLPQVYYNFVYCKNYHWNTTEQSSLVLAVSEKRRSVTSSAKTLILNPRAIRVMMQVLLSPAGPKMIHFWNIQVYWMITVKWVSHNT